MNHDVLVIGGGWAGIAAAVEATQRGRRVTLVETHAYLGGRARSFVDRTTGEEIDNGQHVAMGCYHTFLNTLETLGVVGAFTAQKSTRVVFRDVTGRRDVLDTSKLPGRLGIAWGILRLHSISLKGRLGALRLARRVQDPALEASNLTCLEFLRRESQTEDAIDRFWTPIVLATLNAPIGQAAASLLVTVLKRAFFGSRTDSAILVPKVGLGTLTDTTTAWIEARGGSVRLSTAVDRLIIDNDRVTGVKFSDGSETTVKQIVCAVPQRSLLRLIEASVTGDARPHDVYSEVEFSPIVSVYLWYDTAWMTEDFVAAIGSNVQWVFNRRQLVASSVIHRNQYPGHVSLTISAASELAAKPIDEIIIACDLELRMLFAQMQSAALKHGIVVKEKQATPLITPANAMLRPSAKTSWVNVALAGDWTDTGLPATLEGAAWSGVHAVDALAG